MIRAALALSLLAMVPTVNDCGGGSEWDQPQKRPAQCAPKVHFPRPVKGTVVDIKRCAGLFGYVTTYVRIDVASSKAVVWTVAPPGEPCQEGEPWDLSYGNANACPT